jgi:PGF-pre-PGF domain-containing protein
MRKNFSSIVLLVMLLLPAALAVVSTIDIVSAAGNVTINDFTCENTKGTVPFTTRLTGNVTGEVTQWRWDFYNPQINHWSFSGDKGSSVTTGHTFGAAGAYGVFNVTLVAWGPGGSDSLKKIDFVVGNKNTTGLPVANFTASPTSGNAPLKVTFTDNSKGATSNLWYFGLTDTSKEKNQTFSFTSPGTYRVVLEVSNSRGWDATAKEIIVHGQETVIPKAAFDADTSNGLNVQFSDLSQNGNGFNWDFGDGTNSAEFSPAHTYSTAGNYTVHLTASNENGTDTATKQINVQESSSSGGSDNSGSDNSGSDNSGSDNSGSDNSGSNSDDSGGDSIGSANVVSSGGSGGSGSAGLSPENQSDVEAKELSQTFIGNGNSANFDFPQNATPVMKISFDSKKTAGKTTAIVEMLINQSSLVSEPPSDEVYKFINIWVGSSGFATPKNIENAVVYFKVEKSLIQDKNLDKSSITLNRYNDTKIWNVLPTNLSGEDDKYIYYTAQTPAFSSPFAITGKVAANADVNATSSETQTGPNTGSLENNVSNSTDVKQTPEQTQSQSTKTPGFEAVCGIIGLLGVFLYKRSK